MAKKVKPSDKKNILESRDVGKPDALIVKSQSSCEVKRDAKGNTSFTVKVYSDNPDDAVDKAIEVYGKLEKEYVQEGE